jgi:hypothetical protein
MEPRNEEEKSSSENLVGIDRRDLFRTDGRAPFVGFVQDWELHAGQRLRT